MELRIMNVSAVDYPIDIPDFPDYNIQPVSNTDFAAIDPVDQIAAPSEIGSAAVVTLSAVAQENIQTQQLQQDFLYNLDELKNGNISNDEFSKFLEEYGLDNLNIQEETLNNIQNGTSNNTNLVAALFTITQDNTIAVNGEQTLSSYADYMDRVNEQTQSADVNEKLSAYTSYLRS